MYQCFSGALISEIESAHYLAINDMAVCDEIVVTGGKDTKVRVWLTADVLCHSKHACRHFHEFGEAQMEITQVQISTMSNQRLYAASLDKTCRVYDVPAKCLLRQI